jgi:putative copper export protein
LYAHRVEELPAFTGFSQVDHHQFATRGSESGLLEGFRRGAVVCGRFPPVKRTAAALVSILATMLVAAPAAMAENGVGLAGPTTDKTVTFFCFGVIAFFAALVIVMSLIQAKLEKRKERRRSDLQRFS